METVICFEEWSRGHKTQVKNKAEDLGIKNLLHNKFSFRLTLEVFRTYSQLAIIFVTILSRPCLLIHADC